MNYELFLSKSKIKFFILFIAVIISITSTFLFLRGDKYLQAQTASKKDAIAIRVIPNPEHYSPLRWYKNQGFTGSPQSLTIDGYEAIRDGRSVYVNAANIVNNVLYANIYLISYNQDAEKETTDIFSKILKNWKFNINVTGTGICGSSAIKSDCSGTVGCWPFDDNFNDYSRGNNGTDNGTGVAIIDGIIGNAAGFDGVDDIIGFGAGKDMFPDPKLTIALWLQLNSLPGGEADITQHISGVSWAYMRIRSDNKPYFAVAGKGSAISSLPLTAGNWNYLVGTYDGSFIKYFVNGQEVASVAATGNINWPSFTAFQAGGATGGTTARIKGQIDDLKIYNKAFSGSEISDIYKSVVKNCSTDEDCAGLGYCNGPKANVTRDTIRLSRLVELNLALEEYKNKNGHYPKLESGTYLPNTSVSTWPSWQETLGKELGINLPVDPINQLGACPSYEKNTCWDKDTKKFADADLADLSINPPAGSDVFIYSALANGSGYSSCAVMDSGFITGAGAGACSGSAGMSYSGTTVNNPPVFTGSSLAGSAGEVFTGYLAASDADGDFITWSINTAMTGWTLWSAPPALQNSPVKNQKKVYSTIAGKSGNYTFSASISDGFSTTTQNFTIKIKDSNILTISASDITYTASSTNPLNFLLTAQSGVSRYPLAHVLNPPVSTVAGFGDSFAQVGSLYEYRAFGIPATTNTFNNPSTITPYNFSIQITDTFGVNSTANFMISIVNHQPTINIPASCSNETRVNTPYSCSSDFFDPDGNFASTYLINGQPAGLSIDALGSISGSPASSGFYNSIKIDAADEYGYWNTQTYSLKVFSNSCAGGNVNFDSGFHNALAQDTNSTTTSVPAASVPGGAYLKLSSTIPRITPYIWIAVTPVNKVSKIRTFDGEKMECVGSYPHRYCYLVTGVWERRGQLVGTFTTGTSPRGAAVNAETGDAWVGGGNNVYKFRNDGTLIKSCAVGGSSNGIAIEENGDVWVSITGGTVKKISGDDNPGNCVLATVTLPAGNIMDLAVDASSNIWGTNRQAGPSFGGIQKIDTTTDTLVNFSGSWYIPAGNSYYIGSDISGNIFASSGFCTNGHYKVPYGSSTAINYSSYGTDSLGLTVDPVGNIWVGDITGTIDKVNQAGAVIFTVDSGGASNTIDIDSASQIWAINGGSGNVRVFDLSGNTLSTYGIDPNAVPWDVYCVYDVNGNNNCFDDGAAGLSSYGDGTGMKRSMLFKSGEWTGFFDGGHDNEFWGNISWQQLIDFPAKQSAEVKVRVSNDPNFMGVDFNDAASWNAQNMYDNNRRGRYLGVLVKIKSDVSGNSPVVWDIKATCDPGFVNPTF